MTVSVKMREDDEKIVPFEKFLRRDVRLLRLIGLDSMKTVFTDDKRKTPIWEPIIFQIGVINLSFVVWFEICKIIELWGEDPLVIIAGASEVVSGFFCVIKALRLCLWRSELYELLRRLAVMWDESDLRVKIREENIKIAAKTCYVGKVNIIMLTTLCLSYAVRPYILLLTYQWYGYNRNESYDYTVTVYTAAYPWSIDTTIKYVMCVSWEQFVLYFVASYWMASDVVFAQLTTHIAIQFRVLCHDLETITSTNDYQERKNERKLIERLSTIAERHRHLYTYCETIQNVFNPILLLTLILTAANMCFCAFYLQQKIIDGNWEEVMKSLFHTATVTVQAFIYCGYSYKLSQQSGLMAQAAYNCEWPDRSKEFNVMLHIIMMRSQRPFECTAYGIFQVNYEQITTILKTAGSFFTLLQSLA